MQENVSSDDQSIYALPDPTYYAVEDGDTVYYRMEAKHNGS